MRFARHSKSSQRAEENAAYDSAVQNLEAIKTRWDNAQFLEADEGTFCGRKPYRFSDEAAVMDAPRLLLKLQRAR